MRFAADYPFLNILWSMILFFAWVAWIWTLIVIIGDLFRRHDASGWTKAAWLIFLIVLPFLGVLIYLIANSRGMAERSARQSQAARAEFDDYVKTVATNGGGGGAASEIEKAKGLLDSGAINQSEFEAIKAKALAAG
jgi:general stress protein CsbA